MNCTEAMFSEAPGTHTVAAVSVAEPGARLTEAARALAAANIGLARKFARDECRRRPHLREEIDSAAMLGLCNAANSFDPARGAAFSTLAYICMKNALKVALDLKWRRAPLRMFSDLPGEGRSRIDPSDHRPGSIEEYIDRESASVLVRKALEALSERERFVVQRVALDGAALHVVAAELSEREGSQVVLSRQRINFIVKEAILRMSRVLLGPGAERKRAEAIPPAEELIPIGEVPDMLPAKPDGTRYTQKTVEHWTAGRIRGPILGSVKIGKRLYTTRRDLRLFIGARWRGQGKCLQCGA